MKNFSSEHSSSGASTFPNAAPASRVWAKWFALALISMLGSAGMLRAQVTVTPTVTFAANLSLFSYSYAVTNSGSVDLAIITFGAMPANPSTVMSLVAPTGFGASFDSGLGLISFFEDGDSATPQTFAPGSTVSPFTFTSANGPGLVQFEALDANGNSFTGTTSAPVPEPSTLALLGLSVLFLGVKYRRGRQK